MSTAGRSSAAAPGRRAGRAGRDVPVGRTRPDLHDRAAVLPHRLHGAVAPPVPLPPQLPRAWTVPRSRPGPLLVHDPPAGAADRHGEVGVLGEGVVADAADLLQRLAAERADRARAPWACSRSTSYMRRSRLNPITYSMCCQRPRMPARLPTLALPDTAPTAGRRTAAPGRDRRRLEDRVAVDHDDDVVAGLARCRC